MKQANHIVTRIICIVLLIAMIGIIPLSASAEEEPTALDSHNAFIDYMNLKAERLGMMNTHFNDSIGMNNTTTARDFVKLMIHAYSYKNLENVWPAEEYTVSLGGESPREVTVKSTIRGNEHLDPYYTILSCKDGELTHLDLRNLAVVLKIPGSNSKLAVVALGAFGQNDEVSGSRAAVRQIADAAMLRYLNPDADTASIEIPCKCAIACLIPENGVDPDNLTILYEKNADTPMQMASITKVMTAVCLLDVQQDLEETFTYLYFDTVIGGYYGNDFYVDETISFHDALYALLLPSSNITARALAREGGKDILENGIPEPTLPPEPTEPPTLPPTEAPQEDIPVPTLPQREPPHLR